MDDRSIEPCFHLKILKECDSGEFSNELKQFVAEVFDFSSQYGGDASISYTAYNLPGKPSNYPEYGDFPQAFVMRTFGNWWSEEPVKKYEFMPQNVSDIPSHDYVDVGFVDSVYPTEVHIYETYNPGAVVRIWASDGTRSKGKWSLLWEGPPLVVPRKSRIFSPRINQINFKTRILRIEFNHSLLDYYTGIDAIQLIGTVCISESISSAKNVYKNDILKNGYINSSRNGFTPGGITQQVIQLNLHNIPFESNDLNKVLSEFISKAINNEECKSATIERLPDETILKIFGYLDLRSLGRVSQVNRHLHDLATDSYLYSHLTFHPYWHFLNDSALRSLSNKCFNLQRLDLSWCGNYGLITSQQFIKFLTDCCNKLTHIRLNCCKFVRNPVMKALAQNCKQLKEISIRNCDALTEVGFLHLTDLTYLETLDLYRTKITTSSLIAILKVNPQVRHLNLGSCTQIQNMDDVLVTLGNYNKDLISLDLWKIGSFGSVGMDALSRCSKLQVLDLGWCIDLTISVESVKKLAKGCRKLKKLCLTALRGISDKDLEPFIIDCPELEQIDLLGVHTVTPVGCAKLLYNLPKLRYLDLSFCYQISDGAVANWRHLFPNVAIIRSTQSEAYN